MASDELKLPVNDFDLVSPENQLHYIFHSLLRSSVNTAIPVVVTAVERNGDGSGAGYLSALPLIMQRSAKGESLPNTIIPKLPYFRYQHGTAAFICDPKVGDIGLAVFAQADSSNVNGDNYEKPPASFRRFDMSDGFYIGGFYGEKPDTFVQVEDSGSITIKATEDLTVDAPSIAVSCDTLEINAETKITLNAPLIELNGAISGGGSGNQNATFTGDVVAQSISLVHHTHRDVEPGSGSSGTPQ